MKYAFNLREDEDKLFILFSYWILPGWFDNNYIIKSKIILSDWESIIIYKI